MKKRQAKRIKQLRRLMLKIWRQAEHAEAQAQVFDDVARHLAAVGILPARVVVGKLILARDYSPSGNECETCQIWQAALLLPGGFGALVWDSEAYLDVPSDYELTLEEAKWLFVPFAQCPPVVKALLIDQANALFDKVFELVQARRRWLEPLTSAASGNPT